MSKPVVKRHTFNLKGEERKLDGVREHVVTFLVTGETTVPVVFINVAQIYLFYVPIIDILGTFFAYFFWLLFTIFK